MRNWAFYLAALALPPALLGFSGIAGQSSGIARTLTVLLAVLALFTLVMGLLRRRS